MCSWCSRVRIKATVIESPKCFAVIPTPGSTLVVGNIHVGVNTSRSPSKEEGRWAGETIRTHAVIGALYLFLAKSVLCDNGGTVLFLGESISATAEVQQYPFYWPTRFLLMV